MARLLVVTSCTGEKARDPPYKLLLNDFHDPARLAERERALEAHRLPAGMMYTGDQHRYLMEGVRALRAACPGLEVDVRIVSAGYGLLQEHEDIAPYEVTFNDMGRREARAWATRQGVPRALDEAARDAAGIVCCLGERYMDAIGAPSPRPIWQVFFAKPDMRDDVAAVGGVFVPSGRAEATRYGAGLVALKGRMFQRLARGLASADEERMRLWMQAPTTETTVDLIERGR